MTRRQSNAKPSRDEPMNPHSRAVEMLSLEGKVGIVTGGASGIGRGIAIRLAEMDASVAVFDVNLHEAERTIARICEFGGKAVFVECDVRSAADCCRAVDQTVSTYGRIDILCNNAGIMVRKDVVALEEKEWDAVLDVGLKGAYLLSREVIPHMIRNGGGAIVNTGSGWSLKGGAQAAAYCAAKGGILNLTRAMAIDFGPKNIRVNCICPGDTDTPMLAAECSQLGDDLNRFMQEVASRPLHRVGTPEDIANAILFLVSDMAKWITGAFLPVDGGGLA